MIALAKKPRATFPKEARLRKSREFRFVSYRKVNTAHFLFLWKSQGKGRLGVSLPKKVLRRAVARNRVRRLLKEAFRLQRDRWSGIDLHVVGKSTLADHWRSLSRFDVDRELEQVAQCR